MSDGRRGRGALRPAPVGELPRHAPAPGPVPRRRRATGARRGAFLLRRAVVFDLGTGDRRRDLRLGKRGAWGGKWASFSGGVSHFARGREGAYFAAFTATAKLSLAAGIVLVAATLAFAETDPSRLRWVMMVGPVAASALMALLAVVGPRNAHALDKAIKASALGASAAAPLDAPPFQDSGEDTRDDRS